MDRRSTRQMSAGPGAGGGTATERSRPTVRFQQAPVSPGGGNLDATGGAASPTDRAGRASMAARAAALSGDLAKHLGQMSPEEAARRTGDPYAKGNPVFFRHNEEGWLLGKVHRAHQGKMNTPEKIYTVAPLPMAWVPETEGQRIERTDSEIGESVVEEEAPQPRDLQRLRRDELAPVVLDSLRPINDLMVLPSVAGSLHEAVVLQQLRSIFHRKQAYVQLGRNILVSVNPGVWHPELYSEELLQQHLETHVGGVDHSIDQQPLGAHIWSFAKEVYWNLLKASKADAAPQAVVFTGSAGSGKTECMKLALRFLAAAAEQNSNPGAPRQRCRELGDLISDSVPVIEAFGNACTHRHTNSSRSVKWTDLHIAPGGALVGGQHHVFMLERTRVVNPPDGERSFHCFYHLIAGMDGGARKRLGLSDARRYEWLFKQIIPTEEDDARDKRAYQHWRRVLGSFGFAQYELDAIDQVLAGIIHLRSVSLEVNKRASVSPGQQQPANWRPEDQEPVKFAAALWGIDPHDLFHEVASATTTGRREQARRLTAAQAHEARDSICKLVYGGLFGWILNRMNEYMEPTGLRRVASLGPEAMNQTNPDATLSQRHEPASIGLLDLFGFEDEKTHGNGLEQLLINAANEDLQRKYNINIFEKDAEEYREEGVEMAGLVPPDSMPTIELIAGKVGVLALLDEQSRQGQLGSDSRFLELLAIYNRGHPALRMSTRPNGTFGVVHCAGLVWYGPVTGWRQRNADPMLRPHVRHLFNDSTNTVVQSFFSDETGGGLIDNDFSHDGGDDPHHSHLIGDTVSQQFRNSLGYMRDLLQDRKVSWVRCINPGTALGLFQGSEVLTQLRHNGIMETLRVQRAGYPVRLQHLDFIHRFWGIVRGSSYDTTPEGDILLDEKIDIIFKVSAVEGGQIGRTKVFLKDVAHAHLERLRAEGEAHQRLVSGFIMNKMAPKLTHLREREGATGALRQQMNANVCAAQNMMSILFTNLPIFLSFCRGYLALDQLDKICNPPDRMSMFEMSEAGEDDREEEPDIPVNTFGSQSLGYLDEYKQREKKKAKTNAVGAPPEVQLLDAYDEPRSPSELKGPAPDLHDLKPTEPQLETQGMWLRSPKFLQYEFQSIILRNRKEKMDADALFDAISHGKREVHAPLQLSKEAIAAVRHLVQQAQTHSRHMELRNRPQYNSNKENQREAAKKKRMKRTTESDNVFPNKVGPFATKPVPSGTISTVSNGRYTVRMDGPLAMLKNELSLDEGRISPLCEVNLPAEAKRKAFIPRFATHFAWAYPLPGMQGLIKMPLDWEHHAVSFITFGGFIYLDKAQRPCAANACMMTGEPNLHFDGPYTWTNPDAIRKLKDEGRLQPITIQPLLDVGALFFSWLVPGEDLGVQPPPKFGGFVYLFRKPEEPPHPDDRYFCVGTPPEKTDDVGKAVADDPAAKVENVDALVPLPQIEGVPDLAGKQVPKRVYDAVQSVIAGDHAVHIAARDVEPLGTQAKVQMEKAAALFAYDEVPPPPAHARRGEDLQGLLSPVRHHRRPPDEFVDVPGGYSAWTKDGIPAPQLQLNYDGAKYPFDTGVSTLLSPPRSRPFFMHSMQSNARTACGRSVDGHWNPGERWGVWDENHDELPRHRDPAQRAAVRSAWREAYLKGLCGGVPAAELKTQLTESERLRAAVREEEYHGGHARYGHDADPAPVRRSGGRRATSMSPQGTDAQCSFMCLPGNVTPIPVLDLARRISYKGSVTDVFGVPCVVSFPGKYSELWDSVVNPRSMHRLTDSVACVFLQDKESGLGQHAPDPENPGRCYCCTIYGQVDRSAYLRVVDRPQTEADRKEYRPKLINTQADAKCMDQTLLQEDKYDRSEWDKVYEEAMQDATRRWEKNKMRAPWGCQWFSKWKFNIDRAVAKRQRLVVYFFKGQRGKGKLRWQDLAVPSAQKRMRGFGLGDSQKAEVAYLDHMVTSGHPEYAYVEEDVGEYFTSHSSR